MGLSVVGSAALTGCSIRLERDAPQVPLVPRRQPVGGEGALLTVLSALSARGPGGLSVDDSTDTATTDPSDTGASDTQTSDTDTPGSATADPSVTSAPTSSETTALSPRAAALRAALLEAGVPVEDVEAAEAAPAPPRAEEVTALEAAVADADADLLPLAVSLLAARRLDDDLPESLWSEQPESPWADPAPARTALAATRAADYAFTLIAARGGQGLRPRVQDTRETLDRLATRQSSAGRDDGSDSALGYALDPVTTRAEAEALGERSASRLVDAYLAVVPELDGDRSAAYEVARWVELAGRQARAWGAQEQPLPGMQV